jgi:glutathione S-transferase
VIDLISEGKFIAGGDQPTFADFCVFAALSTHENPKVKAYVDKIRTLERFPGVSRAPTDDLGSM